MSSAELHVAVSVEQLEQLAGHVLVRADEVEKQLAEQSLAVQTAKANSEAEATRVVGRMDALEQSTIRVVRQMDTLELSTNTKLGDAAADVQALRALVAQVQVHVAKLNAASQTIDALQARVAELERKPKLSGSSSGTSRPATCDEMEARVEALAEFRRKGRSCSVARAAGYSCVEAKEVDYSLQEAKAAGFSSEELRMAGYIGALGMTSRDLLDRHHSGCSNFAGLAFSGEDFSNMVLNGCNLSGCELRGAIFDGAQLTDVDLSNAKLSGSSWKNAHFKGSCNLLGADLLQIFPDRPAGLMKAARKAGCRLKEMKNRVAPPYSCSEAKEAGYTPFECREAGYSFREACVAGYPWNQLAWSGERGAYYDKWVRPGDEDEDL